MSSKDSRGETYVGPSYFPDGTVVPELMTTSEVTVFLRIPEISKSEDYRNVIDNLVRFRGLPRIRVCNRRLFPRQAVIEWINSETVQN